MKPPKMGVDDYVVTQDGASAPIDELPRIETGTALPAIERDGEGLRFRWVTEELTITTSNFHDGREGATGEILIEHGGHVIHWSRHNFVSTSARVALAKKLRQDVKELPWPGRLESVCRMSVEHFREGAPTVPLEPRIHALTERMALMPLMPRGQTALAYTKGGSGKSLLGDLLAISIATGTSIVGFRPYVTGPVWLGDWEANREEHETNLARLMTGLGLDPGAVRERIFYRSMACRLADDLRRVRQDLDRHRIVAAIIDSVVPAAGAEAEGSEAAVRLFGALRQFGPDVSRLMLGHITKSDSAHGGASQPFGSVFYTNLSRSVWEIQAEEALPGDDHRRLTLVHRKVNAGPKLPTFGIDFHFQGDRITVSPLDLASHPESTRNLSHAEQILFAVRNGPLTTMALAVLLEAKPDVVSARCRELRAKKRLVTVERTPADDDRSTTAWALASHRDDQEPDA
jgi:hypothetical protein